MNKRGGIEVWKIPDFFRGLIIGLCAGLIITGITAALINRRYREKELIENAEMQTELQGLWEDYRNSPAVEFLDDPAVRGAVDGATGDFERKRDELLQRFRGGIID